MIATFIRLQGCTVHCSFCDEKGSWSKRETAGTLLTVAEVKAKVRAFNSPLVVITGGEPLEYAGLRDLVLALRDEVFPPLIQLETSGLPLPALREFGPVFDSVCISPKTFHTPAINDNTDAYIGEEFESIVDSMDKVFFKLVVANSVEFAFLALMLVDRFHKANPLVFVHPMAENTVGPYADIIPLEDFRRMIVTTLGNKELTQLRGRLRFGIQLHKFLGFK
jgi:organic radical activating enzyme